MHWGPVGVDAPAIARDDRVDPVVVHVAVEDLQPMARPGESDRVGPVRRLVQAGGHHYVAARADDPSLEGDHPVGVVDVEDVDRLAAQGRLMPAQGDQLAAEAQMILHGLIRRSGPPSRSRGPCRCRSSSCPRGIPGP